VKTITVPARLADVDRVRAFLRAALAGVFRTEEEFFKVELAVVEMCVNIVRYAYSGNEGDIAVTIRDAPAFVEVEIRDGGIPFDPRSVPKPDLDRLILSRRTGGLGIYLARTLMDGFAYRREDGQNVLTLTKKK
jgi:anti-sigma regulatory factor (Ser/Thr protein kinase)